MRPRRAAELARTGLVIGSRMGDARLPAPPCLLAGQVTAPFDVVLLSCKAYDLDAAMDAFAPAVGPDTAILPMLNGMRHLDALDARFGAARVLGGECLISTTLDAEGRVIHLNDSHIVVFGERNGAPSARTDAIAAAFAGARFDSRHSDMILQEMWEKWVLIATGAGITGLMRATIGDIVAAGAADLASALLDECAAIAAGQGFPPRPAFLERTRRMFTAPGSSMTASMARDIERGAPIEAEQILGDLLGRAEGSPTPLLRVACAHVKAYEARRAREQAAPAQPAQPA